MNPVERISGFLQLAGIDRPAEKTVETGKGKSTYLVQLADHERSAAFHQAREKVFALLNQAEEARDLTISAAKLALIRAVELGELLISCQELFAGEFEEWLTGYCSDRLGRSTAYRYMKAVRYKNALGDEYPEYASLKELFVAAGIMPAPESGGSTNRAPAPLFRLRFECTAGGDPAQWDPLIRKDFIQQARPVAELLEKALAAEEDE